MATRATIGYLNPSNSITTTYNHYDGYPESLGVALKTHYATDEKAKEVANMGYISYIDAETGEIEANNTERPQTVGGGDDLVSTLQYFKDQASEGDYAYLWSPSAEEWLFAPTAMKMEDFVDAFALGIDPPYEDDMMEEKDYMTEWKNFLNEESFFKDDPVTIRWEKVRDNAYRMLKNEPGTAVNDYVDALERQIKKMPSDLDMMIDWEADDFLNDFREFETRYM
jgi:hypothetical protein